MSDKISSTEFRGSVDTFGITQKLGSIPADKNMNNMVDEIVGSDDSDLDEQELSESSEDMADELKRKLQNAKKMAFQPTQLLQPLPDAKPATKQNPKPPHQVPTHQGPSHQVPAQSTNQVQVKPTKPPTK